MALVPRYSPSQGLSGLPSARVRSFVTEQSQGGGVGAAISDIAQEAMQTADAIAVMDAERKARESRNNLLHNPETGAYTVKGKNALGLSKTISADLDRSISDIEKTLATPKQKAIYRQRTATLTPETVNELNRYGIEQAKQYESVAIKAYKETAFNEAITYYTNPLRVSEAVSKVKDANLIEYKDQPIEALEAANASDQSSIYTAVTTRMIDDNPLVAEKFYQQNKGLFLGKDQERIEDMLKPKVMQYNSMAKADTIIKSSDSPTEWRKQAREITDPEERSIVMTRLKEEQSLREQEKKMREEASRDAAWNSVFDGGSLRTLPAALLASLDPKDRRQIADYELDRAEGKGVITNWALYEDLQQLPVEELKQTDLSKYYGQLAEPERKELIKKKANSQKGTTQIKPELTFEQQFTDTAPSMLFPATAKTKNLNNEQKQILGRVRSATAAEVTRQETAKSGFLTMEERQKIIDQEVMKEWQKQYKVEIDRGGFFDDTVNVSDIKPGEWSSIDFDDTKLPPIESIPVTSQKNIQDYAKSLGVTLTDKQIQKVYLLSQVNAPDDVILAVFKAK